MPKSYDVAQVRRMTEKACRALDDERGRGGKTAFCRDHDVPQQVLSDFMARRRENPPSAILKAHGLVVAPTRYIKEEDA
jgi:hypothetical protein